jgi:hypothetical protein
MVDPSTISASIDLGKGGWPLLEQLRSVVGADIISAYFKHDGTRIEGSTKIEIELNPLLNNPTVWFYSVKPIEDYVFVREPVTPSCAHELVGTIVGEDQPNSCFWRWIAPVLPGRIYGGSTEPPNLKVDFLVFGYRPRALLKHFGEK